MQGPSHDLQRRLGLGHEIADEMRHKPVHGDMVRALGGDQTDAPKSRQAIPDLPFGRVPGHVVAGRP